MRLCLGYWRSTSRRGIRASVLVSLTRENNGLSMILSLIKSPTATSKMLKRNGTRQPQARNASSGSPASNKKMRFEKMSPAGTPICGQLP